MEIKIKPWNGSERLYFYRQSQQIAGQTGQIGKLRADFDRDRNGFFSTWEDIRDHLKTEEFKQTLIDNNNKDVLTLFFIYCFNQTYAKPSINAVFCIKTVKINFYYLKCLKNVVFSSEIKQIKYSITKY